VVVGSDGDDTILTGDQDDVVEGGSGNDVIQLGDGNDSYGRGVELAAGPESTPPLQLGDGAEDLQGGDDWVRGGQGDDVMIALTRLISTKGPRTMFWAALAMTYCSLMRATWLRLVAAWMRSLSIWGEVLRRAMILSRSRISPRVWTRLMCWDSTQMT